MSIYGKLLRLIGAIVLIILFFLMPTIEFKAFTLCLLLGYGWMLGEYCRFNAIEGAYEQCESVE